MYLQQHQQQVQEQWILEQQQNQQLQAQQHQQMQMQRQNLAQDSSLSHQSTRKRGLATEADEFMGIKKRNLGSEATAQGMFGFTDNSTPGGAAPDTPGSVISNFSADHGQGGGYFDQPYFSGSSSAATSPHGMHYLGTSPKNSSRAFGTSAPATPAGLVNTSSSGSSATSGSSVNTKTPTWGSFGQQFQSQQQQQQQEQSKQLQSQQQQGPGLLANHTNAAASGAQTPGLSATNVFASTSVEKEPFEYRLFQEQQKLHETQLQEQQRLALAQQQELLEMQRHQEEQSKAVAMAKAVGVHHDHNDPATWGYDAMNMTGGGGGGQFTGYLSGYGKGYTPAAIGGVAALAAMAAASREAHRGGGSASMDMDM